MIRCGRTLFYTFVKRRGDACHRPESLSPGPATEGTACKHAGPYSRGAIRCQALACCPLAWCSDLQKPRVFQEGLLCHDVKERKKSAPWLS